MTRVDISGAVGFLTKGDLDDSLHAYRREAEEETARGLKYFRLPRLYAVPSNGTVRLGEAWAGQPYTGQVTGPREGYVWSIRRLACSGLGTGTSPDILNIYRNGVSSDPFWQLNGNNWGYTFGKTEMLLLGGERMMAQSVGSLVSTAAITLTGDAVEVPAELIGKLVQ